MTEPGWIIIARRELGIHETPGPKATARIVKYHKTTSLKATSDEVPWCSAFANWCLLQADIIGTGSAAAKSWLTWGHPCGPAVGAITILQHRVQGADASTGSTSGYHVGFWVGATSDHVQLLGGNQSDSVKVSSFPLSSYSVLGYRWPK